MADIDVGFYPKADPDAFTGTASKLLGVQQQALGAQQSKLDLVKNQVNYLVDGFSTLASKKDLTQDDFINFGRKALAEGIISPDVFQAEMETIAAAGGDPEKLRNIATNYGLRALDAGQRFTAQYGTINNIPTGNTIQPTAQSPLWGSMPVAPPIEMTNTPQDLSQPATVMGPNGPQAGTQLQALEAAGMDPLTGKPKANPLVSSPEGSPAPLAAPAPLVPLPVGEVEAASATGSEAGKALAEDRNIAANYQANITPISEAIKHIDALGDNATGPGSEDINTIQSFLQTMGIPITDPQKVANFDELKKYLVQLGRTNGNTGTNDQLASALAGSPGTTVSTMANKDILKTLYALARLKNAQVMTFDASGEPQSQYGKWGAEFNSMQDPRAYAFDLMNVDQRKKLIEGMSDKEKAKFVQSLKTAVALGLVQPPNG